MLSSMFWDFRLGGIIIILRGLYCMFILQRLNDLWLVVEH